MKKLLPVLFLLSITTVIKAQNSFAPVGAKWVYHYSDSWGNGPTCSITSVRDTIILGKACRRMNYYRTGCTLGAAAQYMYSDSGKVYFYDTFFTSTNPRFQLLFDINAIAGDKFVIDYGNGNDSIVTKVDSVRIINISGHLLKQLSVHVTHNPFNFNVYGGKIIENIGSELYMFPWRYSGCNEFHAGGLICYTDPVEGTYYIDTTSTNCDLAAVPEITSPGIKIFPNPAKGKFIVSGINKGNITLFNVYGEKILSLEILTYDTSIDLSGYPGGVYILQIEKDHSFLTKKIVNN